MTRKSGFIGGGGANSRNLRCAAHNQERQVVGLLCALPEAGQVGETFGDQSIGRFSGVLSGERVDPGEAILLARVIPRFRQTIGIQKNAVTLGQGEAMDGEARAAEHSQRDSRGVFWSGSVSVDVKKREMASADELHGAIVRGASHDESRVLSGESAFAENAVGGFDHAVERETGFSETAKRCVEMAHEHGSSDTFAGNVSQHEEQTALRFDKVAIVAADHPSGLIVKADIPSSWRQSGIREESTLDARGQREIVLQGTLFSGRKVVETEPQKRIGQQPFRFYGLMARFAKPKGSLIEATEGVIHSGEKLGKRSIRGG